MSSDERVPIGERIRGILASNAADEYLAEQESARIEEREAVIRRQIELQQEEQQKIGDAALANVLRADQRVLSIQVDIFETILSMALEAATVYRDMEVPRNVTVSRFIPKNNDSFIRKLTSGNFGNRNEFYHGWKLRELRTVGEKKVTSSGIDGGASVGHIVPRYTTNGVCLRDDGLLVKYGAETSTLKRKLDVYKFLGFYEPTDLGNYAQIHNDTEYDASNLISEWEARLLKPANVRSFK